MQGWPWLRRGSQLQDGRFQFVSACFSLFPHIPAFSEEGQGRGSTSFFQSIGPDISHGNGLILSPKSQENQGKSNQIKPNQTSFQTFLFLLWLLPALVTGAYAQTAQTNEPLRQISANVFQLGTVRLDKSLKTVQFPAVMNMREGLIEYLLVNAKGKAYESLLRTETEPYYIHLAMLLIGAKGAPPTPALLNAPSVPFHVNRPASATNSPPPLAILGDPVTIELAWPTAHGRRQLRAEDCIMNLATKTNASRGPWTYNGSRVLHGVFIAQRDASIVAMIDDIDAMMNNPRPGHENDQIWEINSGVLPPTNTPVEVTFKLETLINK